MKNFLFFLISLFLCQSLVAQNKPDPSKGRPQMPNFTPAQERLTSYAQRQKLLQNSLVRNVPFRNAGPDIMSGRVVDLAVFENDPSIFFVAYASGGLWKTENNGLDFVPLFDNEAVMTIGDIAVRWNADGSASEIWIGTGENNSSRSSYSGLGIYKSTDQGKTWQHMGLEESHHIGRIVLHPSKPEVAWVAVLGHLYSNNPERGVYKTEDGGKTWKQTLFVNGATGAVDLVVDPKNPDNLYVALWERNRKAWNFAGNGKNSGIYKSTDGGVNWAKLNTEASGFPATEGVGRIGLAVYEKNPNILYAVLDNQDKREKEKDEKTPKITIDVLSKISKEDFLKFTQEEINEFLDKNDFPKEHFGKEILEKIEKGTLQPKQIAEYLGGDANSDLFNTPIKGAEVYRSDDAGKTWRKTHEKYVEDLVYTYGYYFGQFYIDPNNVDRVYTIGVPIIKSEDGGKTWASINGDNVHVDHHALWLNPKRKGHMVLGNDGGVNISYDDGKTWAKCNSIPVGQFYAVNYDLEESYNIYGGLQDNGVWFGKNTYKRNDSWQQNGIYPYKGVMGGDGMQVEVDWRDNTTIYTGYQFGNYFRINKKTNENKYITPQHKLGEKPFRFNWQTPIHLSRHNQDILYMGSNFFHRSMDKGETWEKLSNDLTKGGKEGNVPYGTLTSIDESPKHFGLLYVGIDDGLVHISKDGGYNWTKITDGLPADMWVSRVEASNHAENRVYVSLNGYRWDNFEAMLYVSDDYGKTWKRLGTDLPKEPINVVREDDKNENVLYVGTDHGLYVSVDRGSSFMLMNKNLPAVSVHDLAVHHRDRDLIVGTHGCSLWVAKIAHIQELTKEILAKNVHLFDLNGTTYSENWGKKRSWREPTEAKTEIGFFAGQNGEATIQVKAENAVLKEWKIQVSKGLNYSEFDFSVEEKAAKDLEKTLQAKKPETKLTAAENGKFYLPAGNYEITITIGNTTEKKSLELKPQKERTKRIVKKTP